MLKSIAAAGLLAALATAPLASAQADVIYSITQTGPTVVGPNTQSGMTTAPYTTNLQVIVTDEAAANGFSINVQRPSSGAAPQIDGLVGILLQVFSGTRTEFSFDLAAFLDRSDRQPIYTHIFSLTASAGGLLSGEVYGNNTNVDTRLTLNGTRAVTGFVNSDELNQVCSNNNCSYSAVQTRTAVPEPMSIALFGAGLAGLAVVRRRKA